MTADQQNINKLKKASLLLTMVERLMQELSRYPAQGGGIPWEGMKLTLAECRKQIESVQLDLPKARQPADGRRPRRLHNTSADELLSRSPLAKRIKRLPVRKETPAGSEGR